MEKGYCVLPYEIFEKLVKNIIDQQRAEEELFSGLEKYNAERQPFLRLPLTTSIIDIIEELYRDDNKYPTLSWWFYEGNLDEENYVNEEAILYEESGETRITTIKDLWEYMEDEYRERLCRESL